MTEAKFSFEAEAEIEPERKPFVCDLVEKMVNLISDSGASHPEAMIASSLFIKSGLRYSRSATK